MNAGLIISGLLVIVLAVALCWRWAIRKCESAMVADWGIRWLNRLDGLNRLFCRKFHRLRHNSITLPDTGGALLVSNHISGLDPLLMAAASTRPLRFIIAKEEYDRWWLRWFFDAIGCIPVERTANPQQAFRAAREALMRGEVIALFPHGKIHLDHEPPVRLKRGVALLAQMTGVPVCPMRIEGVCGEGMTVVAVILRSHVRITYFEQFEFNDDLHVDLLRLRDIIQGSAPALVPDAV